MDMYLRMGRGLLRWFKYARKATRIGAKLESVGGGRLIGSRYLEMV